MPGPDDLLLAIDQGTGSTKTALVDSRGAVVSRGSAPLDQQHPEPRWVEQDPEQIWGSVGASVRQCLESVHDPSQVVGIALSVQRETVVAWDRASGEALSPAISWQDQRTADAARRLIDAGHAPTVRAISGLPLDPMFSALKASWILDQIDADRARARAGEICIGTVDAWLLSKLGCPGTTERGSASRTQLLDIGTGEWSTELLDIFDVPAEALPVVVASTGPFPTTRALPGLGESVPVVAVLADSHAALFAHAGWRAGVVKATYGTGSSVMAVGWATDGGELCETIAWDVEGPVVAIEANIRSTGRTMTWLSDLLGCDADDLFAEAALAVGDGTTIVPAFGGLGAPWWDPSATPVISGFSLGTGRAELALAGVESIAMQVDDVLHAYGAGAGDVRVLAADGGMTRSTRLMQLQADVSGVDVRASAVTDLSARGAADLAGLVLGWWTWTDLESRPVEGACFTPDPYQQEARDRRRRRWAGERDRARMTPTSPR